jgi:hypothetical protein
VRAEAAAPDPSGDIDLGRIDADGCTEGVFGELPYFRLVTRAGYRQKSSTDLNIVLRDGCVLVRKGFRGNREPFEREKRNLTALAGCVNVPALHAFDSPRTILYKQLIPGWAVNHVLAARGGRILQAQTHQDKELLSLTADQRIGAVLARGAALVPECLSAEFVRRMSLEIECIHRVGVVKLSVTFGNIIVHAGTGEPWFIDLEDSRAYPRWHPAYSYWARRDWRMFRRCYPPGAPASSRNQLTCQHPR